MRRAPRPASAPPAPLLAAHPLARPAPRLRAGALALAALLAGCADRPEPPVTRESAPSSAAAPEKGVAAPSSAGVAAALPVPAPVEGASASARPAEPDASAKKPATVVELPHAPSAAPAVIAAPSALASATPSAAPLASAAPTATAVVAVPPAPTVESPKVAEASFNLWMQAAGKYKAGQPGAVQIVLVAQGAFHCNDKYPYKFKLGAPPAGVSYPQPIVRVEGMSLSPARSVMTVPFVPGAPGDARISGTFSFSVCSASSCQLETRDLAINVKVD